MRRPVMFFAGLLMVVLGLGAPVAAYAAAQPVQCGHYCPHPGPSHTPPSHTAYPTPSRSHSSRPSHSASPAPSSSAPTTPPASASTPPTTSTAPPAGGNLPVTGPPVWLATLTGFGMVMGGGFLLVGARRRRVTA